jgi:predicted Zn finger-like uncharacterized protein
MFISCTNCNKNFDVDSTLIPENGRLLQCSACNYQWFFKKQNRIKPTTQIKVNETSDKIKSKKDDNSKTEKLLEKNEDKPQISTTSFDEKNINKNIEFSSNKNTFKLLSIIIVFIISFIALIIILDTFKGPITKIIPNIEFLLYNFYESIKDTISFFRDLIQ